MASPKTPQLIIPDDKVTSDTIDPCSSSTTSIILPTIVSPTSCATKKKLTKLLSTQASFDYHHVPYPITKRFSIDADPSSIISHIPIIDLSNSPLQQQSSASDLDASSLSASSSKTTPNKEILITRSPTLKKSDSFLEIPYEKGEIVDLIKLVDDPNAAAHITNDGQEVLVEHGAAPH
ncbi:hypothetical protein I4U23_023800 [Adineta vaga]|nr:hypothetical protein I4U23_023800 [Adineta vaga]